MRIFIWILHFVTLWSFETLDCQSRWANVAKRQIELKNMWIKDASLRRAVWPNFVRTYFSFHKIYVTYHLVKTIPLKQHTKHIIIGNVCAFTSIFKHRFFMHGGVVWNRWAEKIFISVRIQRWTNFLETIYSALHYHDNRTNPK